MKGSMSDFVNKHQPVPQSYQPVPQSSDPFILAESGDSAVLILRSRAGDFVTLPSQRGEDSDFSHPGNIGAVPLDGLWRLRPNIALVKGDDFDPVRALAGRVASDRLQRAGLSVDRVRRDSDRLLAGHDNESAGRVDIETAGLLLGRRASEIGELSTRGIDAEGGERARRALRSVEKAAVR